MTRKQNIAAEQSWPTGIPTFKYSWTQFLYVPIARASRFFIAISLPIASKTWDSTALILLCYCGLFFNSTILWFIETADFFFILITYLPHNTMTFEGEIVRWSQSFLRLLHWWKHLPYGIQFDPFTRRFGNFWYQGQMADLHTSPTKLKNTSTHGIISQLYYLTAVAAPDAAAKEKREGNCTTKCPC